VTDYLEVKRIRRWRSGDVTKNHVCQEKVARGIQLIKMQKGKTPVGREISVAHLGNTGQELNKINPLRGKRAAYGHIFNRGGKEKIRTSGYAYGSPILLEAILREARVG